MTAMRPTEVLMSEHRVIERVLDCLERIAERAHAEKRLPRAQAETALEILGTFADRCHHAKEEHVLFPALERRGLPHAVGPVAVMLREHEEGRDLIARMRDATASCEVEPQQSAKRFATAAGAYVGLLREHFCKEDGVLFPMAESMMDDAERARVFAGFEKAETHDVGAGTHERMLGLVDSLARELGVAEVATSAAHGGHGGCCHGSCH
jgi:hemerythrin-like domain-containing protein